MGKSVFELDTGDILSVYNRDFIAEQVYKIGTGSAAKMNCLLKDGSDARWFAARNYDSEILVLGEEIELEKEQQGEIIALGDENFKLIGTASGRAIGTSDLGLPRYINMEYHDYSNQDGRKYLFIQKSDDRRVAFFGETVIGSAVFVFPNPDK